MVRFPDFREIYRGVRKKTAPPTRVEPDSREKLRKRAHEKEMDERRGGRSREGEEKR